MSRFYHRSWAALASSLTLLAACGGGGGGGNSPAPSPPPPSPPDTTAPETTLANGPASLTSATSATFTFSANETSSFEGRLDGGAYAAVTSPHTLNNVAEGSHTFEVRARDSAGNLDATPASASWTVDTTPPDTQITAAPSATGVVTSSTFGVNSTEAGGTLEMSVDGGPFQAIPSATPITLSNLADGPHTVRFRAVDAAGNVDASPATASWTLDATPAQVRLLFPPRNFYTDATTISVRGTAQDANGVTSIRVNGVAVQTTDNFAHWNAVVPVPVATTALVITSVDGAGNSGSNNAATMYNRGPFINAAHAVAYDRQRNRVLVVDQATGDVVTFDRTTGIGQMLSAGPAPGTTPGSGLNEAVVDAANDRLLILRGTAPPDEIVAVNLATGARSVVSPSAGSASPTLLNLAYCLALDAANQRLYATVGTTGSVIRIDLATGARTVVSSSSVGSGDTFVNAFGIVYDDVSNPAVPRLLVADGRVSGSSIVSIDLATGNRTPFSSATVGTGPLLVSPTGLVLDAPGRRLLAGDVGDLTIKAVALASGDRSVVSSSTVGTGPLSGVGIGAGFDPVSRTLFTPDIGGFGEIDTVAQVRREVAHSKVGTGIRPFIAAGMFVEPANGPPTSLLYLQSGAIFRLSLDTSNRSVVSWPGVAGSGPPIDSAMDMVLDRRASANGRAVLVLIGNPDPKLISVDLVTGDRTLVANINMNIPDSAPLHLALDAPNNRALFTFNRFTPGTVDEIYALNLATGAITLFSGPANAGPAGMVFNHMISEPAVNPARALISDYYAASIYAVDLASGNRSLLDSVATGSGVGYTRPGPLAVDSLRSRLLVQHIGYPENLFARPLAGGARELISGANPMGLAVRGNGPPFYRVTAMDADSAGEVAYAASSFNGSIIAIDLVSGDRVVMAR